MDLVETICRFGCIYFGSDGTQSQTTIHTTATSMFTSVRHRSTRAITSILTWTKAFQLYSYIYVQKYPHETSELIAYMMLVQSLSSSIEKWHLYDVKFCHLQAVQDIPWTPVHMQTYFFCSIQKPSHLSQPFRAASRQPAVPSSSPHNIFDNTFRRHRYCWIYQRRLV